MPSSLFNARAWHKKRACLYIQDKTSPFTTGMRCLHIQDKTPPFTTGVRCLYVQDKTPPYPPPLTMFFVVLKKSSLWDIGKKVGELSFSWYTSNRPKIHRETKAIMQDCRRNHPVGWNQWQASCLRCFSSKRIVDSYIESLYSGYHPVRNASADPKLVPISPLSSLGKIHNHLLRPTGSGEYYITHRRRLLVASTKG